MGITAKDIGFSLDSPIEDPKISFPGLIVVSEYRLASERFKEATDFRPQITGEIPQWDIAVKRLDAIRQGLDGSQRDALYPYGPSDLRAVSLKKWSAREQALVRFTSRHPREHLMVTEFKRLFGTIEPPEGLVGKLAMFDFWPEKRAGRVSVRNVLTPTSILPPDYKYVGEITTLLDREWNTEEQAVNGGVDPVEPTTRAALTEAEALSRLLSNGVLQGKKKDDIPGIIAAMPAELRIPPIMTPLALGQLIPKLEKDGLIEITAEDTINVK